MPSWSSSDRTVLTRTVAPRLAKAVSGGVSGRRAYRVSVRLSADERADVVAAAALAGWTPTGYTGVARPCGPAGTQDETLANQRAWASHRRLPRLIPRRSGQPGYRHPGYRSIHPMVRLGPGGMSWGAAGRFTAGSPLESSLRAIAIRCHVGQGYTVSPISTATNTAGKKIIQGAAGRQVAARPLRQRRPLVAQQHHGRTRFSACHVHRVLPMIAAPRVPGSARCGARPEPPRQLSTGILARRMPSVGLVTRYRPVAAS